MSCVKVPPWLDHPAKFAALFTHLVSLQYALYSNTHKDLLTLMLHIILCSSKQMYYLNLKIS